MIRLTNKLFHTQPIVAHAPGPPRKDFERLCHAAWTQPERQCRCDDLTVITWNNGGGVKKPCGVFERSLARLGIQPVVLGQGIKNWRNAGKLRLVAEALAEVRTPYVLIADSTDVLIFDSPAVALERFHKHFTCDLVFNATGSTCWPDLPEFVSFESSLPLAGAAQGRHWLNSGVCIGRTPFAREYFSNLAQAPAVPGFECSDQAVIKQQWPKWHPRVQLDYLCVMFQWINEERNVVEIARPLATRQQALLGPLRTLGGKLRGAEVGVWDGSTSDALLRELPNLELWMVDPWRPYVGESTIGDLSQESFDRAKDAALWWTDWAGGRRHVLREASPGAARRFADGSLDFAFIDGNHLYEPVRSDVLAWWPKIREGGLLAGHDYGVYRDASGAWGVKQAVDEFAASLRLPVERGDDGIWWVRK